MTRIQVGMGSCGVAAGARPVYAALERALAGLSVELVPVGCLGACHQEVLVEVQRGAESTLHAKVLPEDAPALVQAWCVEGRPWPSKRAEHPLSGQRRIALRNCGQLDPGSLDEALARGGFEALRLALAMPGFQVVDLVEASGLRGRGGGGFPTGRKWRLARASPGPDKVLICNADEGDPGAFMDRNLLEGDPFAVLEGMLIAAWAIGANQGFIYVREEYPGAVERVRVALQAARAAGWLGQDIGGVGFHFDIQLRRGAGAFVCGEETALIASLEGRRGVPRPRPPYPVESGYKGLPTVINNVETFANLPWILANGAEAFRACGTPGSAGTKVFSLAGDIRRTGMVEVPMGITLRALVEDIGGGPVGAHAVKAVQIGGPAGGCIPAELFDTPVDYESLSALGALMGSGGLVVLDERRCMVDLARYFLAFTQVESCGRCTFCRIGTLRMRESLERLCSGRAVEGELEMLEELSAQVRDNSLCGLGRAAPNPVFTTLRHFRSEYEAHLRGCCPAGRCKELITYSIDPFRCDGCTLCMDQCIAQAITTQPRAIHLSIDASPCVRCGGCFEVCRFNAVEAR